MQEDKDRTAAWRMPVQVYLHWMAFLLEADPKHWRQADCLVQEVKNLHRRLHQENLPRRLMYLTSADRWIRFKLNYMCMNLKAKCLRHGKGRS